MPKKTTKNKQFRPDFGVFICPHVASGAAVLQVVRDAEGDWQSFRSSWRKESVWKSNEQKRRSVNI